jgi:ParB-like chromosome segregation protein Spo0J
MTRQPKLPTVDYESTVVAVADIVVTDSHREVDEVAVKALAESISRLGLQTPITIRHDKRYVNKETAEIGSYVLITGRHRLEAFKLLGETSIPANVHRCSPTDARLWEISENLHRSDLTKLERASQINEWRELVLDKGRQVDTPSGGRQSSDKGFKKTAKELGIPEPEVRRSEKIATLSPEALAAAAESNVDNNQSVLLAAAKEKTSEGQVAVIKKRAAKRPRTSKKKAPEPKDADPSDQPDAAVDDLVDGFRALSQPQRKRFVAILGNAIPR